MTTNTILHIAAHMGGGIGKALSNVAIYDTNYDHHLVLIEKPTDTQFTNPVDKSHITIAPTIDTIQELVQNADIVQWDWWHHPLMANVMHSCKNIPMRSVVWSHTSGCYYPYIKPEFVSMPDHFIFTSPYSKDNPYWITHHHINSKASVSTIHSSGGFKDTQDIPLVSHNNFNVGYLGTLGYAKLLPEFIEYCKEASDIPNIKFVMIGNPPSPNILLEQAKEAGIADKFVFTGWVQDLTAELACIDVMGYLLNKYHYGTTENALLEAMSMGIPPVALNQCAEKYLIVHDLTGFLVNSKYEYSTVLSMLHGNKKYRTWVGKMARKHVTQNFNLDITIAKLGDVYSSVMIKQKRIMEVGKVFGDTPFDWYRSGFPPTILEDPMKYRTGNTNGSVGQWRKYYPELYL